MGIRRLIGLGPKTQVTIHAAGNKFRLHKNGMVEVNKKPACPFADLPILYQQDLVEASFLKAIRKARGNQSIPDYIEQDMEGLVRSAVERPDKEDTFQRVFNTFSQ